MERVNMKASLLASHLSVEPTSTWKQQIGVRLKLLVLEMFDTPCSKFVCISHKISPFLL